MKRLVALGFALGVFLATHVVEAQPRTGVVLEHEGETGIWLGLDSHRAILADLTELRVRQSEVGLLREKLGVREIQLLELRMAVDASVEAQNTATSALVASERGRRQAEAERDAWHRSRALWGGAGIVVSIAIMLTATRLAP